MSFALQSILDLCGFIAIVLGVMLVLTMFGQPNESFKQYDAIQLARP